MRLTASAVEKQIAEYPLVFSPTRRTDVEWGMAFPTFIMSFYKYIDANNTIPMQQCYWEFYLSENSAWFKSHPLSPEQTEGLKARIYRTYPSLVRDVHFSLLLKESNAFDLVVYNESLDIEYGIDLIVRKSDKVFAVNLYTETRRAYVGRDKKQFRHQKIEGLAYIELPVEFKGSKQSGSFFLYSKREADNLYSIITKSINRN